MTEQEVRQKAREYIDTKLAENADWLDTITDSWIYDAENWFEDYLENVEHITIWENEDEYEYTPEANEYHDIFWCESLGYQKQKDIEINGARDGIERLRGCLYDLRLLQKKMDYAYQYLKPHFTSDDASKPSLVPKEYFDLPMEELKKATEDIKILGNAMVDIFNKQFEKKEN